MVRLIGFALALISLACDRTLEPVAPEIPEAPYHGVFSKEEWGEQGFISQVGCMALEGARIFLSDYINNRLLVIDEGFNFIAEIGTGGQGPGELMGANYFAIYQDQIFVYNDGARRLEAFTLAGEFLKSIPCTVNPGASHFLVTNDTIYMSTPWTENPITAYDLDGNQVLAFGKFRDKPTLMQRNAANVAHLALMEIAGTPRIISALVGNPYIDLYSLEGTLLNTFDLGGNKYLRQRSLFREAKIKESPESREGTFIFFRDLYVQNNRLFLLIQGADGTRTNKILQLKVSEVSAEVEKVLVMEFDQPYFAAMTFCINPSEEVYLFDNVSDQLQKYVRN